MATTIKLKNGSGAPLAGDLVAAEPAFDLTNKRLYTEDSGGTVIEVGTNPTSLTTGTFTSTGIDDNATSTAITIDASENVGIGTASPSVPLEVNGIAKVNSYLSMNNNGYIRGDASGELRFQGGSTATTFYDSTNISEHMRIDSSGRVGIGIAPYATRKLTVFGTGAGEATVMIEGEGGADPCINFLANNTQHWTLGIDDSDADKFKLSEHSALGTNDYLVVDTSGNVGIGTTTVGQFGAVDVGLTVDGGGAYSGIAVTDGSTTGSLAQGYSTTYLYNQANGSMLFGTNNAERMRIDANGNVGIGATSPPSNLAGTNGLVIEKTTPGLALAGGSRTFLQYVTGTTWRLYDNDIGVDRITLDASGNVGIGTDVPTTKLDVLGPLNSTAYPYVVTVSDTAAYNVSNNGGGIGFAYKFDAAGNLAAGPVIQGIKENNNPGVYGSALRFLTRAHGANPAERMRIDSSGNLLVGQTSQTYSLCRLEAANATSEGVRLSITDIARSGSGYPVIGYNCGATTTANTYNRYVNDYASWIHFDVGQIETYTSTAVGTGNFSGVQGPYVARGGTSWTSSSDSRLKGNVKGVEYGLETVLQLKPKIYKRLDRDNIVELGFIAQDVEKVIPEVVVPPVEDSKYYGINYERIIPVLTKAIQEQQAMIEELKAEVAALKGA